jgi:hypothetical protein
MGLVGRGAAESKRVGLEFPEAVRGVDVNEKEVAVEFGLVDEAEVVVAG